MSLKRKAASTQREAPNKSVWMDHQGHMAKEKAHPSKHLTDSCIEDLPSFALEISSQDPMSTVREGHTRQAADQGTYLRDDIKTESKTSLSDYRFNTTSRGSEGESMDIGFMANERHKFTLGYCDIVMVVLLVDGFLNMSFYSQYGSAPKLILPILQLIIFTNVGILFYCHKSQNREKMWLPLFIIEVLVFGRCIYTTFDDSFYLGPEHGSLKCLLLFYHVSDRLYLPLFFINSYILIEHIPAAWVRKFYLVCLFVTVCCIQITAYADLDFDSEEAQTSLFRGILIFDIIGLTAITAVFAFCTFYLQTLQQAMIEFELRENLKYKFMFNSIQDAILVVQSSRIKFINQLGADLLTKNVPQPVAELESVVDQPRFFLFQDLNDNSKQREKLAKKLRGHLSVKDLLAIRQEQINNSIFTTSKELSECTRLDQIQKIIQDEQAEIRETGQAPTTQFFSIRIIRVGHLAKGKKDIQRGHIQEDEEIMIQIQDISLRIQSQYMRVERQYLSLINSTVSHEMRNPLNAMVSQIEKQEGMIDLMDKEQPDSEELESLKAEFKNSLRISKSSTKILRFNVEDILALPQLKAGKFTKNIQKIDLCTAVAEVKDIMGFQASNKYIDVEVAFKGFRAPEVWLDEQRFQQVFLNYLSNALKFTEKGDRIKVLLQYVPSSSEIRRVSQQPLLSWEDEVISFHNKEFIDPSDFSISSENSESSHSSSSEEEDRHEHDDNIHMSLAARKAFLNERRSVINSMFEVTDQPKLVLSLMDNGVGIRIPEQTKLFKLFGTLKSTRSVNTKGVGLGLSISKMIAEEFGGQVSLMSKHGLGSVFMASFALNQGTHVHIPKTAEEEALSKKLEEVSRLQKETVVRNYFNRFADLSDTSKVLIVDDEACNCEVLRQVVMQFQLKDVEKRLVVCMSAKEALGKVQGEVSQLGRCDYSLILTDLSMPGMDGYRFISKLRKRLQGFGIPNDKQPLVAALTGHTESEFYSKAFKKGIDKVYPKPINSDQIGVLLLEAGVKCKVKETVASLIEGWRDQLKN